MPAPPADLPVEQPTKFKFAIHLKIARELGIAPSPALLALAEFAAVLESLRGTPAKCRRVRKVVAIKGKAEVARTSRFGSEGPRADMASVASNVRFQLRNEIALLFER
jgi:hypothetical protein